MKSLISIVLVSYLLICSSIVGCKSKSTSTELQKETATKSINDSAKTSNQIYSEGMNILRNRLSVQSSNKEKALELNEQAIKMFSEAHKIDSSFRDPVFFASECTMYARDYKECIFWTKKLERIDTSASNLTFCKERIEYCEKKLKSKAEN